MVELEGRVRTREHDVGVVKSADRSHVSPVVVEQVRLDSILRQRCWNNLSTEICGIVPIEELEQHVAGKDVYPHRCDEWLLPLSGCDESVRGKTLTNLCQPRRIRFLFKAHNLSRTVSQST